LNRIAETFILLLIVCGKFWHPHLVGSVIPFYIPIFLKKFFIKSKIMMEEHEAHIKRGIKLLEQKEKQFHENINLITICERIILHRYCNDNSFINL
jgi:hypothetical protein